MNISAAYYQWNSTQPEADKTSFKKTLDTWKKKDLHQWIDNLHGSIHYLFINGNTVPYYLPNHRQRHEAYVGSIVNQYIVYGLEEYEEKNGKKPWIGWLKKGVAGLFRTLQLDKTIHIDMNLLSTSFASCNSALDYWEASAHLMERYPRHALVIRGMTRPELIEPLEDYGYWRITNRKIYQVDMSSGFPKKKRPLQQDVKRWTKQEDYEWRPVDYNDENELTRILELYRSIYLEKHSRLNPRYTPGFVRLALEKQWLMGEVLVNDKNYPVAVQLYLVQDGQITTPFIGYDVTVPREHRLYPFLNLRLMEKAQSGGYLLNMSSGAGTFKKQRGGVGQLEFLLVHDRHLPWFRRIPWRLLSYFTEKYARPYLEEHDV
ncbi:GNAT family N-acetyltransferase [bacterium SCSIO 12741]|nr:GNAT family N-acetyltransferase [bacterium SCSIO 12741]